MIPVRLAQCGGDQLVSQSQAKRLLARIDRFTTVLLDFAGVDMIGQAFADEIFRLFSRAHPDVSLGPIHTNLDVAKMIEHVQAALG